MGSVGTPPLPFVRYFYTLTGAAHFLFKRDVLSGVLNLLDLALTALPQRPPVSPTKGDYMAHSRRLTTGNEELAAENAQLIRDMERLEKTHERLKQKHITAIERIQTLHDEEYEEYERHQAAESERLHEIHAGELEDQKGKLGMEITQLKRQLAAEINKRKTRDAATRRRKEERRAYADDLRGKCMTAAEAAVANAQAKEAARAESHEAKRQRQLDAATLNATEMRDLLRKLREELEEDQREAFENSEVYREATEARDQRISELVAKVEGMKEFKYVSVGGRGRGAQTIPDWLRLMIYELIVIGIPAAGVGRAVQTVLKHAVPSMVVKMPHGRTVKVLREETSLLTDLMSAIVLARCERIKQLCHDGTEMNGVPMMAGNVIGELNGVDVDVMVRGCFVALGKTSELEVRCFSRRMKLAVTLSALVQVKSIEEAFAYLRELLAAACAEWTSTYPEEPIPFPHPDGITLVKLAGGSAQSDNAAAAVGTSRLLAEHVYKEVQDALKAGTDEDGEVDVTGLPAHLRKIIEEIIESKTLDPKALASLTVDQIREVFKVILTTCQRHTSNLLIDWGAKAEELYLKLLLEEDLSGFDPFVRISAKLADLLRACGKEFDFRSQAVYAKGDAMTYFLQWLIKNYPKRMVLNSFRAMLGGRQDFELAAAMELWWNRALFVEFLEWRAEQEPDSSRLRSAIAAPLKCIEIVGALYARAVLMDKVFEAVRFFSASGDLKEKENWTTLNMAIVYEAVMDIARRGAVCIFVYT